MFHWLLNKKPTRNTGKLFFLNPILSACIPPCFFPRCLSFSCHVSWGELLCVMNVNGSPPFTCSPKLKQTPPPPQSVLPLSVCLFDWLFLPTSPAVCPCTSIDGLSAWPPAAVRTLRNTVWVRHEEQTVVRDEKHTSSMSDACPPFILQQKNCQHKTALARAPHLQKHVEIYLFVYIDCASVLIFCGFHILADHKLQVGFNLMHRSTFIDSIFYEMAKCSWQRLGS